MLLLLQNVLLVLSSVPLLAMASSRRSGPEGPVGAHMVTLPLALLQAAAIGIAVHQGAFARFPGGSTSGVSATIGYAIATTFLPILAIGTSGSARAARGATIALLCGALLAVNASGALGTLGALLVACGGLLGFGMVGALFVQSARNSMRQAEADAQRMDTFRTEQAAFHRAEYAKLPPDAELWQLIQLVHAFDPEVQRLTRERIAALPDLEKAMRALLLTGWGEHATSYLDDGYPLRLGPLAPEYARFLETQYEHWESTLLHDQHAGKWDANLRKHFVVAGRVHHDGGDLGPQLTKWAELLERVSGLGSLAAMVRATLGPRPPR